MSSRNHAPVSARPRRLPHFVRLLISLCSIWMLSFQILPQSAVLQAQEGLQAIPGQLIELQAGPAVGRTRIGRPDEGRPQTLSPAPASATFIVNYTGFTPQAQAAFQAAVDIWASQITSAVPIQINANWKVLGTGVLGSAGATTSVRNFPGAPLSDTFYPIALASKLAGSDLFPGEVDITANFNSTFPNWYLGTDGNTPAGEYDLVTVVLHEIGHGLGFAGSARVSGGIGSWGFQGSNGIISPSIYDRFVINGSAQELINTVLFANPSAGLGNQLTGDNLFFNGINAVAAGGQKAKLFVPSPFQQGSSYSHLDEDFYPPGASDSLMTPALGQGEAIHNPGLITLGLFSDLGWSAGIPIVRDKFISLPLVLK